MNIANANPSPVLTDTLSPSDGERDGVRGFSLVWNFRRSFLKNR
jgi:hypothetical protein